jgi:hypothetical protein
MKKALHKITAVLIAMVVLLSTLSFTIDMHYCGDVLVDAAIFQKAKGCGMEMDNTHNKSIKKACCKNEVIIIKGQDKLKMTPLNHLTFDQQLFIVSYTYSFNNLFESLPKQVIPHKDYAPPNLVPDIQILDQVFII